MAATDRTLNCVLFRVMHKSKAVHSFSIRAFSPLHCLGKKVFPFQPVSRNIRWCLVKRTAAPFLCRSCWGFPGKSFVFPRVHGPIADLYGENTRQGMSPLILQKKKYELILSCSSHCDTCCCFQPVTCDLSANQYGKEGDSSDDVLAPAAMV